MPRKGIGKVIRIEAIKHVPRDERRVEREGHRLKDRSAKLGIDSRVMRERGAFSNLCIINKFSKLMLNFGAKAFGVQAPKVMRHSEAV